MYDPNKPYTIPQQIEMLKQMFNNQYYPINISVSSMSASSIITAINTLSNNGFKVPRTIYGIELTINITDSESRFVLYYRRSSINHYNTILFKTDGLPSTISDDVIIGVYTDGSIIAANII